jgi:hypothetical protein
MFLIEQPIMTFFQQNSKVVGAHFFLTDISDHCGLVLTVTLYATYFRVIWGWEHDRNMFSWPIHSKMENVHTVKCQ